MADPALRPEKRLYWTSIPVIADDSEQNPS